MKKAPKVRLVGEVCVDVMLAKPNEENSLRLGGVMHAARVLWALDVKYELAYVAPDYLVPHIEDYATRHGSSLTTRIGTVRGAPNVILIGEPTEVRSQRYDLLLRGHYECSFSEDKIAALAAPTVSDLVVFPGNYDLEPVLEACAGSNARIHIDISNGVHALSSIRGLGRRFDTVFLSTSSDLFLKEFDRNLNSLRDNLLGKYCSAFLFKENRGGARFFHESSPNDPIMIEAQVRPIVHSVGVGDCFDVAYVASCEQPGDFTALTYASWLSAEYASTLSPDAFKLGCQRTLAIPPEQIIHLRGISLPWEVRQSKPIYVAAPDFSYVDKAPINYIVECLRYHNFCPRLPVREHGEMEEDASPERKGKLFEADMRLLRDCRMVLGVMIGNDPGTLIELGLGAGLGLPVVVYDPLDTARNLMLTELPDLVSSNADNILAKVFEIMARGKDEEGSRD
ncbi:MAG: nucleoside 2-deoxyribosyltransferase [Chloroflexi bacterium]|nr:nucleoside 2-deoxyribosyltransferase [Chloroflexota bacterium]